MLYIHNNNLIYSHGDDEDGLHYRVKADVHDVHDKDVFRTVA